MIYVNTTEGNTFQLDLSDPDSVSSFYSLVDSRLVTALSIHIPVTLPESLYVRPFPDDGKVGIQRYHLPTPKKFKRSLVFGAGYILHRSTGEPIGEKVWVQAEQVRLTLSVLYTGESRCDLVKKGIMRYNPDTRKRSP